MESNYEQLVEALRHVGIHQDCNECEAGRWHNEFDCCLFKDAADAIEELQQIADHHEQTAKDYWKEACEYKSQLPKLGEWELIDGAEPMRWGCSRCKYMSWDTPNYCPRCGAKMEVQDDKA